MSRASSSFLGAWFGLAIAAAAAPAPAADWKPAQGPLKTRWAKDVAPDKVLPEYPRPQLARPDWLNLNGPWQLAFGKEGDAVPAGKALPETILVPFPVESALSGVMKHADRLWYRRTFKVPEAWAGKRVRLHFGAVDWEATAYVNGKELGTHKGGYDAFTFDVTDALKPGGGEQELLVRVFDPTDAGTQPRGKQVLKPGGIFYTPTTGIWQTVWLEPVPTSYIESIKAVPDLDAGVVRVTVHGVGDLVGLVAGVEAHDGDKSVAAARGPVGEPIVLKIPAAKAWTPDSPFLYTLVVDLRRAKEDAGVDRATSYFGMRKIEVGADEKGVTRLLLNGKPLFQVGPLDQGFWPDGISTAATDEALKYDVEVTKKLGFNMTRKHVKVEPERWYYWCDKLGLLVWQDMPAGDKGIGPDEADLRRSPASAAQYRHELRAMIDGLVNHPSIVMWVVFNEGWGQFDTHAITDWTKRHDPSRLVDGASGWTDRRCGDVHDMHYYPGPGTFEPEPSRAAVLGEFGGLGLAQPGHTWSRESWGYKGAADREDLTRKYETLLRKAHELNRRKGLSAVVYTQLTDVETECNGLLTYDREVVKVDLDRAAAANRGDFSLAPVVREVVPTSRERGRAWRYRLDKPADGWQAVHFDASAWKEGPGGFGTKDTPGAVVRTEWSGQDIWLRREFTLGAEDPAKLVLEVHHDDDAEIYLNGVLAAKLSGYDSDYGEVAISPEARAALKPGKAVLAVHCHQNNGGQYVDVGLGEIKAPAR